MYDNLSWILEEEAGITGEDWKEVRNVDLSSRLREGYSKRKSTDTEAVEDAIESVGGYAFSEDDPDVSKSKVRLAIREAEALGLIELAHNFTWE